MEEENHMMKMKKKTLARFLSLMLAAALLCSLPVTAAAKKFTGRTSGTSGSTKWSYNTATRTLTFTGSGSTGNYFWHTATSRNCPHLDALFDARKIVIGEGITRLGDDVLAQSGATEIVLPKSLKTIGPRAFLFCNKLTSITVPAGVTEFGFASFAQNGLKDIYFEGTKAQWNAIKKYDGVHHDVDNLRTAAIHFLGETPYPGTPFTDIKEHWGRDAIKWAYGEKLFSGVGETEFGPEGKMERGMIVTVLHRLAGEPAPQQGSAFRDIGSTWYTNAVRWAAENGIVNGESAQYFNPGGKVTREQVAKILYGYAAKYGKDVSANPGALSGFSDQGKISSWAREAMEWAVSHGVINGSGGKLDPGGSATRAEVAQIFYNCRTLLA